MQRLFLLLVVAGLSTATPLLAQSRPHMELVQGLRNNGLADLALTYLNELKANNPPPEIIVVLPLEYARTRLALARMETDEANAIRSWQQPERNSTSSSTAIRHTRKLPMPTSTLLV